MRHETSSLYSRLFSRSPAISCSVQVAEQTKICLEHYISKKFHVSCIIILCNTVLISVCNIAYFKIPVSIFCFQVAGWEKLIWKGNWWGLNPEPVFQGCFCLLCSLQEIAGDLENSLLYKLEVTCFMSHSSLSMSPPILFQVSSFKFTVLILNCFMFLVFISLEWFSTVFHVSGKCGLSLSRFCFMFHGMIFAILVSCFMYFEFPAFPFEHRECFFLYIIPMFGVYK